MKRHKLRVVPAVLTAVLASALVSACNDSSDDADGKQSVTMWIYPVIADEAAHEKFWADRVAEFNVANPAIEVKVEIYPWAKRDEALATALASNTGPDVVYLIPDQLVGYAKNIEPIDKYLDDASKADYFDNIKESVTLDGKMLGAPILTSSNPLVCDKRALAAAGMTAPPATWEELDALGAKLKPLGIDGFNYYASTDGTLNHSYYPLLWQAGGEVFSSDGKSVIVNQAPGVKALTFLKEQYDKGHVSKELLTTIPKIEQTRIAKGLVACTWNYVTSVLETLWGKENIVVGQALEAERKIGYGTIGSLSMMKASENKDAAGAWIEFATNTKNLKAYDVASNFFSPKESTGPLYADDPMLTSMEAVVPQMTVGPLHPKAREVMGAIAPAIQAALTGEKTPQQALDDAVKEAQQLLN